MPRYEALAADLRDKINSGQLAPGARLPSIAELKAQCGVSYGTIRSAILVLKTEGLVVGAQGIGMFVASH